MSKAKVLFLCTGNSCRSQMAEGWARHLHGEAEGTQVVDPLGLLHGQLIEWGVDQIGDSARDKSADESHQQPDETRQQCASQQATHDAVGRPDRQTDHSADHGEQQQGRGSETHPHPGDQARLQRIESDVHEEER